jgi:twitching motility protein PilJ
VRGGQDEIGRQEMEANIDEYLEIYKQACTAYAQQKYEVAATLVDSVVQNLPDDVNCHLLRGHVYYVLQHYDVAKEEYLHVLQLSDEEEIISFARNGLENINQYQQQEEQVAGIDYEEINSFNEPEAITWGAGNEDNSLNSSFSSEHPEAVDVSEELSSSSPFQMPTDSTIFITSIDRQDSDGNNPFALNYESQLDSSTWQEQSKLDLPAFWEDISEPSKELGGGTNSTDKNLPINSYNSSDSPFENLDLGSTSNSLEKSSDFLVEENSQELINEEFNFQLKNVEDETLIINEISSNNGSSPTNNSGYSSPENNFKTSLNGNIAFEEKSEDLSSTSKKQNVLDDDDFDFEAFESAFGSDALTDEEDTNSIITGNTSKSNNIEFLDDFDAFDDLGNIPGFEITGGSSSFGEMSMVSGSLESSSNLGEKFRKFP